MKNKAQYEEFPFIRNIQSVFRLHATLGTQNAEYLGWTQP